MMLTPGTYSAKLFDYTTKVLPSGNVIVELMMKELESGSLSKHTMHTTEKTIERTLKTLDLFGLKAGNAENLADGKDSGVLDTDKTVEIVVQVQKDKNGVETQYTHVAFINDPNKESKSLFDKSKAQSSKAKLSALNGKLAALQTKSAGDTW